MHSLVKHDDFIVRFGKPSDEVQGYKSKPFIFLPFGVVKVQLPELLKQDPEKAIKCILECQYNNVDISKATANETASFILWIKEQVDFINTKEAENLQSTPEPELLASGVTKLNEFGAMAIVDSLAGGDILKYDDILALPYHKVYQKMKLDKVNSDIRKKYEKIISKK